LRTSAAPAPDAASYSRRPAEALRKTNGPAQLSRDRRAVHVGEAVVEDDDVRAVLVGRADGRCAIRHRADHVDVGRWREKEDERVAVDLRVLDEKDADRLRRRSSLSDDEQRVVRLAAFVDVEPRGPGCRPSSASAARRAGVRPPR
jgi:hypothetical protein